MLDITNHETVVPHGTPEERQRDCLGRVRRSVHVSPAECLDSDANLYVEDEYGKYAVPVKYIEALRAEQITVAEEYNPDVLRAIILEWADGK